MNNDVPAPTDRHPATAQPTDEAVWPRPTVAWGWVAILVLAYACSYIDRQILSLMIDPIKADLDITDSQFSLLHGLSFAMLYCAVGLPLGALVDRRPRGKLIAIGVLTWSLMTALCGMAARFSQLFAARIGVGAGEAVLSPSAYSLLADCFPPARLGRAMSVYIAGAALGAGLALMVGGTAIAAVTRIGVVDLPLLGVMKPWQTTFLIVGLPGIPLACALWLMPEPARRGHGDGAAAASWAGFLTFLATRRMFVATFILSMSFSGAISLGTLAWTPAYLMRAHAMSAANVGLVLGALTILGITAGLLGSAWLTEFLDRRGVTKAALKVSLAGNLLAIPSAIAMASSPTLTGTLFAIFALMIFANVSFGILGATLQSVTPGKYRGRMSALLLLCQNAVGMVLGPLLPALLTDYVFDGDGKMVGYSLAISVTIFGVLAAALIQSASRTYPAPPRSEPSPS